MFDTIRASLIIACMACLSVLALGQDPAGSAATSRPAASRHSDGNLPNGAVKKFDGLDASGKPVRAVTALAVSDDHKMVLIGGQDGRLHVWQLDGGKVRTLTYPGWESSPAASAPAASAPIATPQPTPAVTEAPVTPGAKKKKAPAPPPAPVFVDPRQFNCVAFSADGNLAAACDKGAVHVWDLATDKYLCKIDVLAGTNVSFSRDGRQVIVVAGSAEQQRVTWNLADRSPVSKADVAGHRLSMPIAAGMGCQILSHAQDNLGDYVAILWTAQGAQKFRTGVNLFISDAEGDRMLDDFTVSPHPSANSGAMAMSHGGRYVAASSNDSAKFSFWDIGTMTLNKDVKVHAKPVTALCFSADDKWLVSGDEDGCVYVWTALDLRPEFKPWGRDLCWGNLASSESLNAVHCIWPLIDGGDKTVAFLKDRLLPDSSMDRKEFARLIADLDSDEFAVRKAAREALAAKAQTNWPLYQEAMNTTTSSEVRNALEGMIPKVDRATPAQQKWAIRILARIDSDAARTLLRGLAAQGAEAALAHDARAALVGLGLMPSSAPATSPGTAPASSPATRS